MDEKICAYCHKYVALTEFKVKNGKHIKTCNKCRKQVAEYNRPIKSCSKCNAHGSFRVYFIDDKWVHICNKCMGIDSLKKHEELLDKSLLLYRLHKQAL
jgi:DnaJ-class molecular chaperone